MYYFSSLIIIFNRAYRVAPRRRIKSVSFQKKIGFFIFLFHFDLYSYLLAKNLFLEYKTNRDLRKKLDYSPMYNIAKYIFTKHEIEPYKKRYVRQIHYLVNFISKHVIFRKYLPFVSCIVFMIWRTFGVMSNYMPLSKRLKSSLS